MTGHETAHWAWDMLRRFNSLLNTLLLVGAIIAAGVWWWHSQELSSSNASQRLNRSVERIEAVSKDLGAVQTTARDALRLARSNEQGLEELRGRVIRGENRRAARDQEMINRLERIERLLLEERN